MWKPIETAPKDRLIIGALITDGRVWRVHDMQHNGLAFYTRNGQALPPLTHWDDMPTLAASPQAETTEVGRSAEDVLVEVRKLVRRWRDHASNLEHWEAGNAQRARQLEGCADELATTLAESPASPPASDPPGLVASLREQVRQWRDRASGIDDDNSYHFNSERHARANQMDECADEIEELLPVSPQAKED